MEKQPKEEERRQVQRIEQVRQQKVEMEICCSQKQRKQDQSLRRQDLLLVPSPQEVDLAQAQ